MPIKTNSVRGLNRNRFAPIVFWDQELNLVPDYGVRYDFVQGADPAVLYDSGPSAKHGTLVAGAAPTWQTYGLAFNGSQRITIPYVPAAGNRTISAVIRASSLAILVESIVGFPQNATGDNSRRSSMNSDGTFNHYENGSATISTMTGVVNVWYPITFIIADPPHIVLGDEDLALSASDAKSTTQPYGTVLGSAAWNGASFSWVGHIGYLAIYESALTVNQAIQNNAYMKTVMEVRGQTVWDAWAAAFVLNGANWELSVDPTAVPDGYLVSEAGHYAVDSEAESGIEVIQKHGIYYVRP